jgi:hypothetical protein
MSLELIKKFLKENGKDSPELSETHIDAAIAAAQEAEKTRYIAEAKKIRADIDKLKPFKTALEEAGYDGTVELPAFVEGLKKAKEEVKNTPVKSELERQISALASQLKTLTTENQAAKERESNLQKERKTAILKERLMKDIGEKLAGGEAHVKTLIYEGAVDLDEDGKTPVFVSGDMRTPYDEGAKKYLAAHKADLKDTQQGGAQSAPGSGRPAPSKDMPLSEMLKLR